MEIETMGKVIVTAKIESLEDLYQVARGSLPHDQVRQIEVRNVLVDTGATILSMPKQMIEQLGLRLVRNRPAMTAAGLVTVNVYGAVRLTIQGRECTTDVSEVPDACPVLIGQVPLELLDFVVDMKSHRLVGNPEHGGEHMIEMY